MPRLDWDDLRFLLAVRQHGRLVAAARALRVNQTTVTRRLAALQESLGARLFERDATGYRLTPLGLRACALAESMEHAAGAVQKELGGRDAGVEGDVRITVPGGFVPFVAPFLLGLGGFTALYLVLAVFGLVGAAFVLRLPELGREGDPRWAVITRGEARPAVVAEPTPAA